MTATNRETTTLADFADFFADAEAQASQFEIAATVPKSQMAKPKTLRPELEQKIQPDVSGHHEETTSVAESNREFLQVATALANLKSELMQSGLLQKSSVKSNFLQVTEFVATRPKLNEKAAPAASQQIRYMQQQLSEIATQIHESRDLDRLLEITVEAVREMLEADRVIIYCFKTEQEGQVLAEAIDRGWTPILGNSIAATAFGEDRAESYRSQQSVAIEDIAGAKLTPHQRQLLEQMQVRASLNLPIVVGGRVWGLLVTQQCSKTRHWQEIETTLAYQISLQLALKLQENEFSAQLQEQAEKERVATQLVDRLRELPDSSTIFQVTTRELRQLLKADRVGIYRFNPDWSGQFIAESVGAGWRSAVAEEDQSDVISYNPDLTDFDRCIVRRYGSASGQNEDTYLKDTQGGKYAQGATYTQVNDIYEMNYSSCYLKVLKKYQCRAYVIVPIFQGTKLWGLFAAYQNSGPRQWQESELNLIIRLAGSLGIALQQREYLAQVKSQSEELAKVAEREKNFGRIVNRISASVIEMVRQSQSLATILGQTAQQIRQFLQTDRVVICRFDADWNGEFVAESVANGWTKFVGPDRKMIWEDSYLKETQGGRSSKNETFAIDDIAQVGYTSCYGEMLEQLEAKAYMVAPIFVGSKLWGLLATYQNSKPRHWEDSEMNLLSQIGSQLGIGIQQGEVLLKIQRQAQQERALVNATNSIRQSLDIVRQSLDITSIFNTVTQEVRQLLQVDRVAVYHFAPDWSGSFIAESVSTGWDRLVGSEVGTNVRDTYLKETEGGRYRNGESLAVNDIYKAGHNPCHVELLEKFQAKAYILVPVFVEKQLWGILGAYQNTGPRQWDESEVNLLSQIAIQFGFALEQAESLNRLKAQSEQLIQSANREKAAKEQLQQHVIQVLSAVRPVFSGDLTIRVPVTEDEVGTIADAYNNTIQSLRKIVTQVQEAATQVTQTSLSSDLSIVKLSQQSQKQLEQVTQALDRIQAMINSTQAVTTNAKQVEIAVQRANQTVKAGDNAMNRTVDGIMAIRETVAETSKKIKRLSESSLKISKVVNLISNFTTQTQLLALNASIEATRAGEYGRGFAVVADEVRSLSRQSAEATQEIEKLVQEIQSEITAVTSTMDQGIQQVVGGTTLVNETRQQLNAIVAATAQISKLVQGITKATQVQTDQSKLVTQAMSDVAEIASKTSQDSGQIAASFQELLSTAQKLQASVGQFKVN
jgi:methyl-accepting chemotaxis protein PixJ